MITVELSNAYFAARYRIFAPTGTFEIPGYGESDSLAELHESSSVTSSAFVTAYNPSGQTTDDATNRQDHAQLVADVAAHWQYLPGNAVDRRGTLPEKPSVLILGISLEDALSLGRKYHQHTIVFSDADGNTDLRACDPDDQPMLVHPGFRPGRKLKILSVDQVMSLFKQPFPTYQDNKPNPISSSDYLDFYDTTHDLSPKAKELFDFVTQDSEHGLSAEAVSSSVYFIILFDRYGDIDEADKVIRGYEALAWLWHLRPGTELPLHALGFQELSK